MELVHRQGRFTTVMERNEGQSGVKEENPFSCLWELIA